MSIYFNEEEQARLQRGLGETPAQRQLRSTSQSWGDYALGFANSAVQAPFEVFGMEAGQDAQNYRDLNPMAGFLSQMVGSSIPYLGWYKATKAMPMMERLMAGVDATTVAKPFMGGLKKEVLRFAPLEAAGIAGTAVLNPERTLDRTQEALFNLGFGGAIGGFAETAIRSGIRTAPTTLIPGIDHELHVPTLKLRQLRENLDQGRYSTQPIEVDPTGKARFKVDNLEEVQNTASKFETQILEEVPDAGSRYVSLKGVGGERARGSTILDAMFRPGKARGANTSTLTNRGENAYGSNAEGRDLLLKALGPRALEDIQFPRVRTVTDASADVTEKTVKKYMQPVADDTWMLQDGAEGLYIVAKKLPPRVKVDIIDRPVGMQSGDNAITDGAKAIGEGRPAQDQWLFFKTDRPEKFAKLSMNWKNAALKAFGPSDPIVWGKGTIGGIMQEFRNNASLRSEFVNADAKGREAIFARYMNSRDTKGLPFRKIVGRWLRAHLAPGAFAFTGPRARLGWMIAEEGHQAAAAVKNRLLRGAYKFGENPSADVWFSRGAGAAALPEGTPGVPAVLPQPGLPLEAGAKVVSPKGYGEADFSALLFDNSQMKPVYSVVDEMADADLNDFSRALDNMESLDSAKELWLKGEMTDGAYKALEQFQKFSDTLMNAVNSTLKKAGQSEISVLTGHYGLSRRWEGDWRIPLHDAENRIVHMIGAADLRAAQKIKEAWKKELPAGWRWGQEFLKGDVPDLVHAANVDIASPHGRMATRIADKISKPKTTRERSEVSGFIGSRGELTKTQIKDLATAHVNEMVDMTYDASFKAIMEKDLMEMMVEDPWEYKQFMERYNVMLGRKEGLDRWQNELVDSVLGGAMGKNSATKIANGINRFGFNVFLGFGNLQHPALTMIGAVQTLLPQVAYVLRADRGRLGAHYDLQLLGDALGNNRGGVGVLSMFKLTRNSFRQMANPDREVKAAMEYAANQGLLFAQMEQEMIGQSSTLARGIKGAVEEDGIAGAVKYMSEFLPRKTEDQARLLAVTMGAMVGKDILKLESQELINRFATKFLQHSMFNYGAHARPQMFQGPVGSVFGLFKNWSFNYTAWMLEYAGAASKGNWTPLLWQLATTTAVAGVGGTAVAGLSDPFVRMATGKGTFEHVHDMFGDENQEYSDAIWHGLPGLMGYTLQGSAAMTGADPARDASMLYNFAMWDRMVALGQAMGGAWNDVATTGQHPISNPDTRMAFARAFLPRSILRNMQLQGDEYVRSLKTHQPIAKLSPVQSIMYRLGFTPREVSDNYEIATELFNERNKMTRAVDSYGGQYMAAMDAGDHAAATAVLRKAMAQGVQLDRLLRSVQAKRERAAQGLVASRMRPEDAKRFQGVVDRE